MIGEREALRAELERLADRGRHPALNLTNLADLDTDDDDWHGLDYDLDESRLSEEQRRVARVRRGAVVYAAHLIVDDCLADLRDLAMASETTPPNLSSGDSTPSALAGAAPDSFVWRYFPPRFRRAYTHDFFDGVLVSAVKVAYDLARPDGGRAACIAEEFILNAISHIAIDVLQDVGIDSGSIDLPGLLLEDLDFENYFDADMDGIEDDPAAQLDHGMWIPNVNDWFSPFSSGRIVHPVVETASTTPGVHDLNQRVSSDDDLAVVRDTTRIDDPRPITSLDPVSDVVRLARAAADPAGVGDRKAAVWVPDPGVPESSFADLVRICGDSSSGRLTWEPHEGADVVRTDEVIVFSPHRHFPLGDDEPWADVAVTGSLMAVPLSAVAAFQPDPDVRARWEAAFSDLFSPGDDQ